MRVVPLLMFAPLTALSVILK
ncbi:hypothetical protein A2U01_0069406, partial [Trifolium medium]|nr:hypothetical protein [Trifolium medium]